MKNQQLYLLKIQNENTPPINEEITNTDSQLLISKSLTKIVIITINDTPDCNPLNPECMFVKLETTIT